jgi:predicted unusual protein kinase regulating ubiquinone biosynthesis (AarF/ABC1/UbiB family)
MLNDGRLGIIDFGCVKEIPEFYYYNYFALINPANVNDKERVMKLFYALEFLYPSDSDADVKFYVPLFTKMIDILGVPFRTDEFDFGNDQYFDGIYSFAEELGNMKELRESKVAMGSNDG